MGLNIFAGIVSTLQNFLKVAELMEGHRIAGVSWGKLQRNIAIELALDPRRRVLQGDFLKVARSEYDRLIEAGPLIDDGTIREFNGKFKNYKVSVPSICNGLDKCNIYKVDRINNKNNKNNKNQQEDIKEDYTDGIKDIITKEELFDSKNVDILVENNKSNNETDIIVDKIITKNEEILDEEILPINKCNICDTNESLTGD